MVCALRSHPGGKTFVQPKIVPPCHRDEIAKPHVRHFVGDDREDILLISGRGFFRIEKEPRFIISNAAPIFHCAAESARNCDEIELRKRIGNPEVVVVVLENFRLALKRVTPGLCFPFRCDDAESHAIAFHLNRIELARDKDHEVT